MSIKSISSVLFVNFGAIDSIRGDARSPSGEVIVWCAHDVNVLSNNVNYKWLNIYSFETNNDYIFVSF